MNIASMNRADMIKTLRYLVSIADKENNAVLQRDRLLNKLSDQQSDMKMWNFLTLLVIGGSFGGSVYLSFYVFRFLRKFFEVEGVFVFFATILVVCPTAVILFRLLTTRKTKKKTSLIVNQIREKEEEEIKYRKQFNQACKDYNVPYALISNKGVRYVLDIISKYPNVSFFQAVSSWEAEYARLAQNKAIEEQNQILMQISRQQGRIADAQREANRLANETKNVVEEANWYIKNR